MAAISRRAAREIRTSKRGCLATFPFGSETGRHSSMDLGQHLADLFFRTQGNVVTALYIVEPFLGRALQPFELRAVFLFPLLQQAETFAYHFARITETAGGDPVRYKSIEVIS